MKHYDFIVECRRQLRLAFDKYDILVDPSEVSITCKIRGRCGGRAGYKTIAGERHYHLKFNSEAITNNWDEMVDDTIPHEIAHIICQMRPNLGSNHNAGWKRVCRALGGDDSRTHDMVLTPAVVHDRHDYNVNGTIVVLGPKQHTKLQKGKGTYFARSNRAPILATMYVGVKGQPQNVTPQPPKSTPPQPRKSTGLTKAAHAAMVYTNNPSKSRADIIQLFIDEVGLTKSGASTYYYNIKKLLNR